MEVRASVSRVRCSPRKARLVVDAVRGKRVMDGIAIARFLPNKTGTDVERLLKSVAANAENNFDLDPEDLWIKAIYADDGPSFRRFKPKARGRVGPIIKRTCSISVVAEDREERR
ncbi:MAG: 50S ribosomal protein L22 [Chloroflexota bacterium]|nr:50S ribosomal protein L22 [Chloroflexia bacterium]MDQ3167741.1 50S ribosomal protein L22 [Chloroflexota bacterium]MDQ3512351.1 50S ribosomal protein L22 [Chloroflexota bacterium]